MTQPSPEALTGPAASILRRRWFWIAFVAVLAVLGAVAGGSALNFRGELAKSATTADAAPAGELALDSAVTSTRTTAGQGNQGQGNQGNGNANAGTQANQGNGQGNAGNQGNGNGNANPGAGNQGNGQGNAGNQGNGQGNQGNGQGNQPAPTLPGTGGVPPVVTPPVVTPPVVTPPVTTPPVTTPPVTDAPVDTPPSEEGPVAPVLTLPDVTPVEEQPVDDETEETPAPPPAPAAVPLVALGIAPGCLDDEAVLVQKAANEDAKAVSVNFLANADFAGSGSKSLTTAPDAQGRDTVTVSAASGKAYVGAGTVSVRTYRAAQTVGGVSYPAVSETRKLGYDAFTCEKPAVLTNVKAQLVNGQIHLAQYARNTGNTTLQVKFNATAHFAASASFSLAPGEAKYFLVPTQSLSVPATSVSVNVVSSVQGKRVALNQTAKHDALSVAVPR
jgi:hypothetical protein